MYIQILLGFIHVNIFLQHFLCVCVCVCVCVRACVCVLDLISLFVNILHVSIYCETDYVRLLPTENKLSINQSIN